MSDDDLGVCVHVSGCGLSMYFVSVYCRFVHDIEPYLEYIEKIVDCTNIGHGHECCISFMVQ